MADIKGTSFDVQRARLLEQEREKKRQELEQRKQAVNELATSKLTSIEEKFQANKNTYAENLELSSVGLVSAEDYKKRKLVAQRQEEIEQKRQAQEDKEAKRICAANRKKALTNLSFEVEDEEEGDTDVIPVKSTKKPKDKPVEAHSGPENGNKTDAGRENDNKSLPKPKIGKDPTVETSFLPDQKREEEERELRKKLELEWLAKQEEVKKEKIEIVYSYWDGSGHRRTITVEKGTRIDQFLDLCRRDLVNSFPELRGVPTESFMYVKEDLIIPHHYTFYDLIVTKARGKSGPLFHFDVHDDVRLISDARIEKDESHAGKVLTQGWYQRNKHVFPASRWEIYDPSVEYGEYTIGGRTVQNR